MNCRTSGSPTITRGAGSEAALIRAAEDEARDAGCPTIVIFAHSFQPHQLYSRLGYEVVARIEDFPSGSDAMWMAKRLESAD